MKKIKQNNNKRYMQSDNDDDSDDDGEADARRYGVRQALHRGFPVLVAHVGAGRSRRRGRRWSTSGWRIPRSSSCEENGGFIVEAHRGRASGVAARSP
mgnify:CR=1 FL=1